MIRHAILHIGTEKTGTTTLQAFLSANRDRLRRRGTLYPRFAGTINHSGLVAYAIDDDRADPIRTAFGAARPEAVAAMRRRLRTAAADELAVAQAEGIDQVILSSEHCHSRLRDGSEIRRLRELLTGFFETVTVCVYLRRQDEMAVSRYSTDLKSGSVKASLLPQAGGGDAYFDYDRMLAHWEDAFGPESLHVRLYERTALLGGSIVSDFLADWRLGPPADYRPVENKNRSIAPKAQAFLAHANRYLEAAAGESLDAVRGALVCGLERWFAGQGVQPDRASARAFCARFDASNEEVRKRYFPDRARLFSDDFDRYPDAPSTSDVDSAMIAEVAVRLHCDAQSEIARLEAEVAIRDARHHWVQERQEDAVAAARRAVRWRPDHADAWRTLGEYLLRSGKPEEAAEAAANAVRHRPASAEFWHFLGMAARRADRLGDALAAQERALALDPDLSGACEERAQILAALEARAASLPPKPIPAPIRKEHQPR